MKPLDLSASLLLVTLAACAGTAVSERSLPRELTPAAAASSQRLAARGVQIYECRAATQPLAQARWTLVAPDAQLFDGDGQHVGRHFEGPQWEADDGSRIVGTVKARADAPQPDAIAWLRLDAASVGGVAPATDCTPGAPGEPLRVPYSADYLLFTD